jgi:enterochelin esterase-like enzyme
LGDGIRVPVVLDHLIAKHEVPPMIGIFVDPGVLPAVSSEVQNRFERVFEYDSLSERYSRFLLEELIPAVAKEYNLSTNPNVRMGRAIILFRRSRMGPSMPGSWPINNRVMFEALE